VSKQSRTCVAVEILRTAKSTSRTRFWLGSFVSALVGTTGTADLEPVSTIKCVKPQRAVIPVFFRRSRRPASIGVITLPTLGRTSNGRGGVDKSNTLDARGIGPGKWFRSRSLAPGGLTGRRSKGQRFYFLRTHSYRRLVTLDDRTGLPGQGRSILRGGRLPHSRPTANGIEAFRGVAFVPRSSPETPTSAERGRRTRDYPDRTDKRGIPYKGREAPTPITAHRDYKITSIHERARCFIEGRWQRTQIKERRDFIPRRAEGTAGLKVHRRTRGTFFGTGVQIQASTTKLRLGSSVWRCHRREINR